MVTRGEASGRVLATGANTSFGKTTELVRTAKTASHLETMIFAIVKYLVFMDVGLVAALLIYALATGMPLGAVVPFALILLVASVPVALPATFTLATALGAVELAKRGVLVTRLSAIEEAAGMDMLASDKTGTITENSLNLATLQPTGATAESDLLRWAALACDDATQDPIDLAILRAASERNLLQKAQRSIGFTPFEPQTRSSQRLFEENGVRFRAIKGAPAEVAAMAGSLPVTAEVETLAARGYRVLAVAFGDETSWWLMTAAALDVAIVSFMACRGILMTAIDPPLIAGMFVVSLAYLVLMDFLKLHIFRHFDLTQAN